MRFVAKVVWVFLVVGCNDVTAPTTAPFNLTVKSSSVSPGDSVPLEGVKVCEMDRDNCVWTDARGEAILMLPIGDAAYTMDKEGYAPWMHPHTVPPGGATAITGMNTAQRIADEHNRVGSPYPMRGTGTVTVKANPSLFAGVTLQLVAATGVPWYVDEEFHWSPGLTETTSTGIGGFTEVTPGEVQVKLGGTADNCIPISSPAGDEPNSVWVPVREGYVTSVGVQCSIP